MSYSTLYQTCLRKVLINLRERIYIPTTANPLNHFNRVPPKLVDVIMSAMLDYQRTNGFRVDDLQPLLISGQLQELKICNINVRNYLSRVQMANQILEYLKSGCQKLKILHLKVLQRLESSSIYAIEKALNKILKDASDLEDLNCCFDFDLRALIERSKLRSLSLHFIPQNNKWYEFLKEERGSFKTHNCLEYFNICHLHLASQNVQYDDIKVVLKHCPEITSLGFIESSGVLSILDEEVISGMKLRHCYWKDPPNIYSQRIENAVTKYPNIEELHFHGCHSRSVPCLQNLINLVFLDIALDASVSSRDFTNAFQVIGPRLKHFSLKAANPMDISLLLKNCRLLESLRLSKCSFLNFVCTSVSLPNLQRLTLKDLENGIRVLLLLRECKQLTELILMRFHYFNDDALHSFLQSNCLLNLNVAHLSINQLTETGFRVFLESAPQLEKLHLLPFVQVYRSVVSETNHRVKLFQDGDSVTQDEFFYKKRNCNEC